MKITFHNQMTDAHFVAIPVVEENKIAKIVGPQAASFKSVEGLFTRLNFQGKKGKTLLVPHTNSASPIFFGLGDEKKLAFKDLAEIGAAIYRSSTSLKEKKIAIDLRELKLSVAEAGVVASEIALGAILRSYQYLTYITKKHDELKLALEEIEIITHDTEGSKKAFVRGDAIAKATFMARDLMCMPPNDLYPESMAKELLKLKDIGIDVEVIDEKQMAAEGMGAILAVGRGSARPPRLVIMKWNGGTKGEKPLAFVGKGITFDTGGISLKPGSKMDEMKMDMGGSAIVSALMKTLALRKAKVNAVGVVALAENMPDGAAYRPGDIVRTLSGQTIEVLNTDAEGRVVLADALWYTQDKFAPSHIIDLATLTGAIIVALGHEMAGTFSNEDTLANDLFKAGEKVGERVWRLPLDPSYNKLIDSTVADVRNTSIAGAGSITAAEFLQRFVNKTTWCHIDIAGVTWTPSDTPLSGKNPTGFGIRLLDEWVHRFHESK